MYVYTYALLICDKLYAKQHTCGGAKLNAKDLVKIVRWDLSNYHALKAWPPRSREEAAETPLMRGLGRSQPPPAEPGHQAL